MITILSGTALLLVTLAAFSLFSFKMPKGQAAMSGMADAAVATFLVEAILNYIAGDIFGLEFLKEVGITSGTMGVVLRRQRWFPLKWAQVLFCRSVPE